MEGEYCITVEKRNDTGKDTARMLAAGADEVYWLRVREGHLDAGIAEILSRIRTDSAIVCESNSLRSAVEPGVFLMMRQQGSREMKASARAVVHEADRIVHFNGTDFDLELSELVFSGGVFAVKYPASLVLLAGGGSVRMGRPKSLLPYEGVSLIEYLHSQLRNFFSETIISANEELPVHLPGARYVSDRIPGYGPMGGIESALESALSDVAFVTACDIPTIHLSLIAKMMRLSRRFDIVVPRNSDGYLEPLHAVYSRSVIAEVRKLMAAGERRIRMVYDAVRTHYVDLEPGYEIENVNTPEEYRRMIRPPSDESW
jgi:molybdopterin-guanine dinucleotide biosynthesis protein A